MSALTLTSLVRRAASEHGARSLVVYAIDGTRREHRLDEVAARALALGRGLRARGLPEGAVVASMLDNSRAHVEVLWGVPAAGLVLHPLNPRAPREALVHALRRSGDGCLLADARHAALARALCDEAGVAALVLVDADGEGSWRYDDLCALGAESPVELVEDEARPAVMCEAAGTVGLPRAVVYSHRALVLHAMACATVDGLGLGRRDVVLPALPLHHANGCGLPHTLALLGHAMVLIEPATPPARLREVMATEGVTFAAGVSSTWVALAGELDAHPEGPALPRGLRLLAGGNAAPPSLLASLAAHAVEVLHVYGMTETGPLASAALGESAQGRVVPLMEMRVVGDGGEGLPWDARSEGEVQLRGPWVAQAYVSLGATPDRWSEEGWLRTGDLGVRDARGSLRLTGRRKPLVRCGGQWVDASALARLAASHPAVRGVSARGVAHPQWVEQPELTLSPRASETLDLDDVRRFLAARWTQGELPPIAMVLAE